MSVLKDLQTQLLQTNQLIAEMERKIAADPIGTPIDTLAFDSIINRYAQLREDFKRESNKLGKDVIDYRIFSDNESLGITSISDVIAKFQKLFSIVFDAISTNSPKTTSRITKAALEETMLGFGYTYSGSIGIALTLPNDVELIDTPLDTAIKTTFGLMEIKDEAELQEKIRTLGAGTIKVFQEWIDSHVEHNISAEVKWAKSRQNELVRTVQIPRLRYIKDILAVTPIPEEESLSLTGNLVGIDIEKRTFHLIVDGQSYVGKFADTLSADMTIPIPGEYTVSMIQKIITYQGKEHFDYTLVSIN